MSDRETDGRERTASDSAGHDAQPEGEAQRPAGPERLWRFSRPQLRTSGYSRTEVDDLLERAAQTVESLLAQVSSSRDELARLESLPGAVGQRLEIAERRSPEEVVGEVLISAHRAAETMIEKARREAALIEAEARRDAAPFLAQAQRTLEEARRLNREARATLEQARAERERLIASASADAERRRAGLEFANMRLETAIKGLRSEWAGRVAEALARLDGVELDAGPPPEAPVRLEPPGEELYPPDAEGGDPRSAEVTREVHARLPSADAGGPVPAERSSPHLP